MSFIAINTLPRVKPNTPAAIKSKMSIENLLQPSSDFRSHDTTMLTSAMTPREEAISDAASILASLAFQPVTGEGTRFRRPSVNIKKPSKAASAAAESKKARNHSQYTPKRWCVTDRARTYNTSSYRFVKNISYWLRSLDVTGDTNSEWSWNRIEQEADELLPPTNKHLVIPDAFDVQNLVGAETDFNPLKKATQQSLWQQEAAKGLHRTERAVCQHIGLGLDKYRVIRAALIIGVTCIYEQNNRGLSTSVCTAHPAITNGKFVYINVGSSQAQCIATGVDANMASTVFKIFQAWGWFPEDAWRFREDGRQMLTQAVYQRYPLASRDRLMEDYQKWEEDVEKMPIDLRFVIADDEWLMFNKVGASVCRSEECPCQGQQATPQPSRGTKRRKLSK